LRDGRHLRAEKGILTGWGLAHFLVDRPLRRDVIGRALDQEL
jgi:hypothetical protein